MRCSNNPVNSRRFAILIVFPVTKSAKHQTAPLQVVGIAEIDVVSSLIRQPGIIYAERAFRNARLALCSWDLEVPKVQPRMEAISSC
jgi:hypothetical protein